MFAGLLVAAGIVLGGSPAEAQVIIQGQGQAGGVYGQGSVYVQPAQTTPSPYVATAAPAPAPTRTIVHTSPTMGLLIPGVIALGGGWLLHGIASLSIVQDCTSAYTCPSDGWVGLGWIPIVGPWLAYGLEYTGGWDWLNIVFGLIQGAGTILTILGVAIQQEWEEVIAMDLGHGVRLAFDGGASAGGAQLGATLTF